MPENPGRRTSMRFDWLKPLHVFRVACMVGIGLIPEIISIDATTLLPAQPGSWSRRWYTYRRTTFTSLLSTKIQRQREMVAAGAANSDFARLTGHDNLFEPHV